MRTAPPFSFGSGVGEVLVQVGGGGEHRPGAAQQVVGALLQGLVQGGGVAAVA